MYTFSSQIYINFFTMSYVAIFSTTYIGFNINTVFNSAKARIIYKTGVSYVLFKQ